ncbi:TlpA family protein disulfide reductase [Chitinophaga eiseniae]|uniref:TlpA family protein disulfide reductase n=1 Tax=Chitinophaga eiseniae TaxID=634771 RepID=A0A847SQU9_9BACT|nr:TlpA disulfide reductase family protein [Chitinophaga eiseniae]NLR82443.1 TlpA family protein disulfide reductase [Chitinophaga eiseniae]
MKNCLLSIFLITTLLHNAFSNAPGNGAIHLKVVTSDVSLIGKDFQVEQYIYYTPATIEAFCNTFTKKITGKTLSFSIKQDQRFAYIRIVPPAPYLEITDKLLLTTSGDDIVIKLDGGKITFISSPQYQCQLVLASVPPETTSEITPDDASTLERGFKELDGVLARQLLILTGYKTKIDPQSWKILEMNAVYKAYSDKLTYFIFYFRQSRDPIMRGKMATIVEKLMAGIDLAAVDAATALNSSPYLYYLYLKERCRAESRYLNNDPNSDYGFNELHSSFMQHYSGPTRDRLLTTLIFSTNFFGKINLLDVLEKDLPIIADPPSRNLLINKRNALGRGKKAYPFKLLDEQGQWVSLDDFKGKVVILDFYFNGCTGCAFLVRAIEPVYQEFRNHHNVAFVSVSIDSSRALFLESVASGIYTHKGGVNLYTNGEGMEHAIIKYYGITGYPKLIIIGKDGNIVDGDPPIPTNNGSNSVDKLRSIIVHAIDITENPR